MARFLQSDSLRLCLYSTMMHAGLQMMIPDPGQLQGMTHPSCAAWLKPDRQLGRTLLLAGRFFLRADALRPAGMLTKACSTAIRSACSSKDLETCSGRRPPLSDICANHSAACLWLAWSACVCLPANRTFFVQEHATSARVLANVSQNANLPCHVSEPHRRSLFLQTQSCQPEARLADKGTAHTC